MLFGLCLVAAGLIVLMFAVMADTAALAQAPWKSAFILAERPSGLSESEVLPVQVRLVQRNEVLDSDVALNLMAELVQWERFEQHVRLSDPEMVIALDLPEEVLEPMLKSGRLPERGRPEVLAGDLARDDAFQIDGINFQVTGRLKRQVSGFLFAYMLPHGSDFADLFASDRGAAEGFLVRDGDRLIEGGLLPAYFGVSRETAAEEESEGEGETSDNETKALVLPNYLGGVLRSPDHVTHLSLLGMALVALGGALFHYFLFRRFLERDTTVLRPFLGEVMRRPALFWGMHLFFYGVFFWAMWSARENPLLAYRTKQYIEAVFNHGGLGHVGAAYDSGRISLAAWMTFYNNFVEQTLGLTFLISLIPIPLGLIKTLLSFLLVGGAMSPLWVGSADTLVMHSITMALELQAYILACFAITVWPLLLLSGIRRGNFPATLKQGVLMLVSAIFLTGVMLAIAAVYEAITLIHFV